MKRKNYIAPLMEQTTCVMMRFAVCSGGPDSPEQQSGNESPNNMSPGRRVF